jgi:hypothetical protein
MYIQKKNAMPKLYDSTTQLVPSLRPGGDVNVNSIGLTPSYWCLGRNGWE